MHIYTAEHWEKLLSGNWEFGDELPVVIGKHGSVCVSVECDANVRVAFADRGLDSGRLGGPTLRVDVETIGLNADLEDNRALGRERGPGPSGRSAVSTVDDNPHPGQAGRELGYKELPVPFMQALRGRDPSDSRGPGPVGPPCFDGLLDLDFDLVG